jgi:selenocysteine lyase/cysteine desulfurase
MVSQTIGMHAAVDYLTALGMDAVEAHEHDLDGLCPRATRVGARRSP